MTGHEGRLDDGRRNDDPADLGIEDLTLRVVTVEAVVALVLALALACGWTLHDGPSLHHVPDPVGYLPF